MSEIIRIPAHVTHPEAVTAYMDGVRAGIDTERRRTKVDTTEAAIANQKVQREQDAARSGTLTLNDRTTIHGLIIRRDGGVSIWPDSGADTPVLCQEDWYPNSTMYSVSFDKVV